MSSYEKQFERISSTGRPVLILKAIDDCECFEKNNLLNSEPDINCPLCFGTGKKRLVIETEKIRYELGTSGNLSHLEKIDFNKATFDIYSFYFPAYYEFLNNNDIIITFDENGNLEIAFEIQNKEKFVNNNFVYYEVFAQKINYLNLEDINEYRKIK